MPTSHWLVSCCNFCLLKLPLPTDTYTLHTDASVLRLGAVLNFSRDGKEKPVAFLQAIEVC